jgi:hypothetical protein
MGRCVDFGESSPGRAWRGASTRTLSQKPTAAGLMPTVAHPRHGPCVRHAPRPWLTLDHGHQLIFPGAAGLRPGRESGPPGRAAAGAVYSRPAGPRRWPRPPRVRTRGRARTRTLGGDRVGAADVGPCRRRPVQARAGPLHQPEVALGSARVGAGGSSPVQVPTSGVHYPPGRARAGGTWTGRVSSRVVTEACSRPGRSRPRPVRAVQDPCGGGVGRRRREEVGEGRSGRSPGTCLSHVEKPEEESVHRSQQPRFLVWSGISLHCDTLASLPSF